MKEILLVEDSVEDVRLLRAALGEESDHFICCVDGESAIRMFRPDRFPVVLVDLKLPGMPGTEVIRRIRSISMDTIIHVITESQDPKLRDEAIAAGATGYFTKPYQIADYRMLMRQITLQAAAFERGQEMKNWRARTLGSIAVIAGMVGAANFSPLVTKVCACIVSSCTGIGLLLAREQREHEQEIKPQ